MVQFLKTKDLLGTESIFASHAICSTYREGGAVYVSLGDGENIQVSSVHSPKSDTWQRVYTPEHLADYITIITK